ITASMDRFEPSVPPREARGSEIWTFLVKRLPIFAEYAWRGTEPLSYYPRSKPATAPLPGNDEGNGRQFIPSKTTLMPHQTGQEQKTASEPEKNGGNMVRIPGGTFRMGSNDHYPEEAPVHSVSVSAFWIDRTPVTNRDFRRFVNATGYVTFAEIA